MHNHRDTPATSSFYWGFLLCGAASNFATAGYTFIVKEVSVFEASLANYTLIYALLSILLLLPLLWSRGYRKDMALGFSRLKSRDQIGRKLQALCAVSPFIGLTFALGLAEATATSATAIFSIIIRLDGIALIIWGMAISREPSTWIQRSGVALAVSAAFMLSNSPGLDGGWAAVWGLAYVVAATVTGKLTKDVIAAVPASALLTLRTWAGTLLLLPCATILGDIAFNPGCATKDWVWTLVTAVTLGGVFWLRFKAQQGLSLWQLWAMAPLHTLGTVGIAWALDATPSTETICWMIALILGELAMTKRR